MTRARLVWVKAAAAEGLDIPLVLVEGESALGLEQAMRLRLLPYRPIDEVTPEDLEPILGEGVVLSEVRVLESGNIYSEEYRKEVYAWYEQFRRQVAVE